MDPIQRDDFQHENYIKAKQHLSAEVIAEIVAQRRMFVEPDLGRELAALGAAREPVTGDGSDSDQWMLDPDFRDFLRRSV